MRGKNFLVVITLFMFLAGFVVFAAPPLSFPELPSIMPCLLTNGGQEICDGLDNDCNDIIDDNVTPPLNVNQSGVCQYSVQMCLGESGWVDDYSGIANYEIDEFTCDALNNDCDSTTDEGCPCTEGQTTVCGPNNETGECVFGTLSCVDFAWSDMCIGGIYPTEEICNGLDDDCDGSVDEDLEQLVFCGLGACSGNSGTQVCVDGEWNDTLICDPYFGAGEEVCDDFDNDCDGDEDEGDVCTKKRSSSSSSSSSSFSLPTSVEINDTNESIEEDIEDEVPDYGFLNETLVAPWEYVDNVASLAIAHGDVHFKRFQGLLPETYFENESTITFIDPDLSPLKDSFLLDSYDVFERAIFDDSYADTRFEELFVTFTVDDAWLTQKGLSTDVVNVLYKSDGAWSLADTKVDGSTFHSRLSNAGLEELLIVAEKVQAKEIIPVDEKELNPIPLKDDSFFNWSLLFSDYLFYFVGLVVILGGGLVAFVLLRHRGLSHEKSSLTSSPVTASPLRSTVSSEKKPLPDQFVQKNASPLITSSQKEKVFPVQGKNPVQEAKTASKVQTPPVAINERVIQFIHKKHNAGASVEEIKQHLRKAHWPEYHITAHINHYHKQHVNTNLPVKPVATSKTAPHHDGFSNQDK